MGSVIHPPVVDNHRVCRREVDAEPSRSRGEEEGKARGSRVVEAVDARLPLGAADATVDALKGPPLGAGKQDRDKEVGISCRREEGGEKWGRVEGADDDIIGKLVGVEVGWAAEEVENVSELQGLPMLIAPRSVETIC